MNVMEEELLHDLRMPLQLILSSAQLIAQSAREPGADLEGYVEMLTASVNQLRRMLDGALDGEDLRRGPIRLTPVDLPALAGELCRRCEQQARAMGATLEWSANVAALDVLTDEDAVSRILLNLIANALRFAGPGGRVQVYLAAIGDAVEITVSDDGPGISPDRLPRVFLRGETDGGHGLGLAIARDFARRLGGTLTVQSEPGRGAAFTLRLPLRGAMVS